MQRNRSYQLTDVLAVERSRAKYQPKLSFVLVATESNNHDALSVLHRAHHSFVAAILLLISNYNVTFTWHWGITNTEQPSQAFEFDKPYGFARLLFSRVYSHF